MRFKLFFTALFSIFATFSATAQAGVVARINLSSQTMNVYVDGGLRHSWAISSGKRGFNTPRGSYRPTVMRRMHYSRKYNNAPMPHSIFFRGGYAIHGTGHVGALGRPASHGCVRLSPGHAAQLYALVRAHGAGRTKISIGGRAPQVASYRKRVRTVSRKRSRSRKNRYKVTRKAPARKKKWTHTFGIDG